MIRGALLFILLLAPPQEGNEKLQKAVDRIAKQVEKMLGRKFKETVRVETQSREDFEDQLQGEVKERDPQQTASPATLAYQLLGLLPKSTDPVKETVQVMRLQTGAYYNPKTKKITILKSPMDANMLVALIFHELVHALQDQEHDLTAIRTKLREGKNHDRMLAFNFLVEGEASFWTRIYQLGQMGDDFFKLPEAAQKMAFSGSKNLNSEGIVKTLTQGAESPKASPALKAAAKSLRNSPPILIRKHNDPYLRGMYATYKVWNEDKSGGIRSLFKKLPRCTRDMMFADDWSKDPRSTAKIELASVFTSLGSTWKESFEDTGGAISFHTLFEDNKKTADRIAKEWDGDRMQVWQDGDKSLLVGIISFNSKRAVSTFAVQFRKLFTDRWHKEEVAERHSCKSDHHHVDGDHIIVHKNEKEKYVIFARGALPDVKDCKSLVAKLAESTITPAKSLK